MPQGKAELQINKFVNTTINSGVFEIHKKWQKLMDTKSQEIRFFKIHL